MKSITITFILVAGVTTALFGRGRGISAHEPTCDPTSLSFPPAQGFNWDALPNVKWYVQEIFFRRAEDRVVGPEEEVSCYMQYILGPYGYYVQLVEQFTNVLTGLATHNGSWAFYWGPEMDEAIWTVHKTWGTRAYKTVITHMDIGNAGIMHWCPFPGADQPYERILTFTGVPDPDLALLEEMRGAVENLGFPTNYSVQIQHHSGCDYDLCEAVDKSCCDPNLINAPPMTDLDLERIQNTPWYIQEIYFRGPATFTDSCFMQTLYEGFSDGQLNLFQVSTNSDGFQKIDTPIVLYNVSTPDTFAVWDVFSQFSLNRYTTVLTTTDYDTYGVMHYCPHHENVDWRTEAVVTFTASPTPDEALLLDLKEMVAGLGFPTGNGVRIPHHANCDYEYHYVDDDEAEEVDENDFET